jgi:multidrug resistance efflux pump
LVSDPREKQEAFAAQVSRLRLSQDERAERPAPRRWWLIAAALGVVLVVALGVFAARSGASPESAAPASAAAVPAASAPTGVSAPAPAAASGAIVAGGRVEAATRLELSVAKAGVVGRVLVATGDRVKAGTVLVELQADEARADLALRRAALDSLTARFSELKEGARIEELQASAGEVAAAEATYQDARAKAERDRKLALSGSVTVSQRQESEAQESVTRARLEQAQARLSMLKRGARVTQLASSAAEVTRAKAELAKAEAQLAALGVVAPVDGVVLDVRLGPGEAAAIGVPLVVLADLDHLIIVADVPEASAARVRVGAQAEGTVEAIAGRTFKAEVSAIALEADRQKGTVEVTVRLLETDPRIRPRMSARVAITP